MTTSGMGAPQPGRDLGDGARRAEDRSIGEILSDVTTDLSTLMRQELELAKAELKQTATRAGTGAGLFGGAAIAGHMVLLFLSISLWWALGMLIGHGWSGLIVAVVWGIVAAVLAVRGRKEMAKVRGVPQTAETVSRIPDALKGNEPTVGGFPAAGAVPPAVSTPPAAPLPPTAPPVPAAQQVPQTYPPTQPAEQTYPATTDYTGHGQETYR